MKNICSVVALAATLTALATASTANAVTFSFDDGTFEDVVGLTSPGTLTFVNRFTAPAGGFSVESISVAFGDVSGQPTINGAPFTAALYGDPNNDGSPADAVLVSSLVSTAQNVQTSTFPSSVTGVFATYDIPDFAFTPGQNFFVGGVITQSSGSQRPGSVDTSATDSASFAAVGSGFGAGVTPLNDVVTGDWLIRANGVAVVPEANAGLLAAFALPAVGFIAFRRRK
ncbi:MAG: hypothetical protein H7Y38_04750 [Armatimonadetes bacterium]|nr:hypothetical protein [Armatimonadota bacterium]